MADKTWADLKADIARDLRRDDLTDEIIDYAIGVIEVYQADFFYGTPAVDYTSCVPGQSIYAIPNDIVSIDRIRLLNGGTWEDIIGPVPFARIQSLDTNVPPDRSIPDLWAPFGGQFRVYSTPDQAYPLEVTGDGKIAAPSEETEQNFWTTDAFDLVKFATMASLCENILNEPQRAESLRSSAARKWLALSRTTNARTSTGVIASWW